MTGLTPSSAFGKLNRDQNGLILASHPLVDHLIDVAFCFVELSGCHAIRRALEHAAGRTLSSCDIARLAALTFLHDLGKANTGFQAKRWLGTPPAGWPHPAGHGREAIALFEDEEFLHPLQAQLPLEELNTWGAAIDSLLTAVISHHGRPIIEASSLCPPQIWQGAITPDGRSLYNPETILRDIGTRIGKLFPEAFSHTEETLPDSPLFSHLFAGMVQLADWVGSDTSFFPFSAANEDRSCTAQKYARHAIRTLMLNSEEFRSVLCNQPSMFDEVFGNPPYPIQKAMEYEELDRLVILESETGSGKTEAALWRFVHLFASGKVDSLYFALPTRVSATQMYERVQSAISTLWPEHPPLVVRALPGYAAADGQQPRSLPDFRVQWPDNPEDTTAHRRWAAESPKRFLAAPIAVGTIDQALLGALQVRHAHLRLALLARSLLVVDEVHASDPYMTALLEHLLRNHLHCGGHALLLSATLGASARIRYLNLARSQSEAIPSFLDATRISYPAITDSLGIRAYPSTNPVKHVSWSLHEQIDEPDTIAIQAINAASCGAKVLIIRNTVPTAINIFRAIESRAPEYLFTVHGQRTLHHSRFSRQDRPLLDQAIQQQLGKYRPRGPGIFVGTQTLEQSLDLDADLLITDLCPMDVLLQRIGRLHRHVRPAADRPEMYRSPQVWVLTPSTNDLSPLLQKSRHGLGPFHDGDGIYPDVRILEATKRLIQKHSAISIPDDNRLLVESTTHPDQLQHIEEIGEAWKQLGHQIEGRTGAQRTIAHLNGLQTDRPFNEQDEFSTDTEITTRLGVRDRLVIFDPAPSGPFGHELRELPVRSFLIAEGTDPEAQPEDVVATENFVSFRFGPTAFHYSRLGLEKIEE